MSTMTSLQRVSTALGYQEPDRVPFFLTLTMHGARELGLTIPEYYAKGELIAEGQLRMQERYGHDCLCGYAYASVEVQAWGGDVIFTLDGPPNSATPLVRYPSEVVRLVPPVIRESPCLMEILKAQGIMRAKVGDRVPIIGLVTSPFSLPVMQMGFGPYLDLMATEPALFARLMAINEEFCVAWANAQLEAGATFICYADPVSSPTIVPRELFLRSGFGVAMRTIARIKGPTAIHLASGRALPIMGDLADTGTKAIGASALEDLGEVKAVACRNRLSVVGNLNAIEMRRWSDAETEQAVKRAIAAGGPGGGFVLADNHGEIPWQVPESVLSGIAEAVRTWGQYPLSWVKDYARDDSYHGV